MYMHINVVIYMCIVVFSPESLDDLKKAVDECVQNPPEGECLLSIFDFVFFGLYGAMALCACERSTIMSLVYNRAAYKTAWYRICAIVVHAVQLRRSVRQCRCHHYQVFVLAVRFTSKENIYSRGTGTLQWHYLSGNIRGRERTCVERDRSEHGRHVAFLFFANCICTTHVTLLHWENAMSAWNS